MYGIILSVGCFPCIPVDDKNVAPDEYQIFRRRCSCGDLDWSEGRRVARACATHECAVVPKVGISKHWPAARLRFAHPAMWPARVVRSLASAPWVRPSSKSTRLERCDDHLAALAAISDRKGSRLMIRVSANCTCRHGAVPAQPDRTEQLEPARSAPASSKSADVLTDETARQARWPLERQA
jgi:hypothetical protein